MVRIHWDDHQIIHNALLEVTHYESTGSEYPRMTKLANGNWIVIYTINQGYREKPNHGNILEIAISYDDCMTWEVLSTISDPGRDMDNGQIIELSDGKLILGCRSVRWQESYRIDVYRSENGGASWSYLSTIDQNEGVSGSLGNPDKGVYEPHFLLLSEGVLSVMYANEKYVVNTPSYSQIISQRNSLDGGESWLEEHWVVWEPNDPKARPGMPVWDRMDDGRYILVFEVCGTHGCNVYYKTSINGMQWESGIGTAIMGQYGGPYVTVLSDGYLLVTSNSGFLSISRNVGESWELLTDRAFTTHFWASVYELGYNRIAVLNSLKRPEGGFQISLRHGQLNKHIPAHS